MRGGSIKIFRRNFFVSQCRKTLQGNHFVLCFGKFPVANKFMDKKGGSIKIFPRNFFVSRCRKTLQGNPSVLCFRKFLVAKKFMDNREGEVSRFSFGNFLSHGAEKLCRGTLLCCVSESFQLRISLWIRRGSIKIFRRNFFVSQCRKTLQGNPFVLCFGKFPVTNKFMDKKGGVSKFSVEILLSRSTEKLHRGTLLCCVHEKFR